MIDYLMLTSVGTVGAGLVAMERLASWRRDVCQRRQQEQAAACLRAIPESATGDCDSADPRQPQINAGSAERQAPKARVPRFRLTLDSQISRWA